jgi:hypothetical protein
MEKIRKKNKTFDTKKTKSPKQRIEKLTLCIFSEERWLPSQP